MRLLKSSIGQGFELTKDLDDDDVPQYAILSHTWGADEEEVSYTDIVYGTGCHKSGYAKLAFCAEQARLDGQTYFWVDTCCIDKSNNVELNTAITSMYRWYEKATKCYVYLPDVPSTPLDTDSDYCATSQADFPRCRWLTRGWTLQELLAPKVVEFYDRDGIKIGDKTSLDLERHICETTGIPAAALRGRLLSSFSIDERLSWQISRQTKRSEDKAYSLMGICGVSMVPIYGEGRDKAMARLRRAIEDESQGPKRQDFSIPFSEVGMRGVESFIGRQNELEKIHGALIGDGSRHSVILGGLGGIGKTQLAVAYARQHKDSYSAIFWLNIRNEASIKQSFAMTAERILRYHPAARHVSTADLSGSLDDIVKAVLAWLGESDNTRWLAIFDNYDNPRVSSNDDPDAIDIGRFLPDAYQGSVIITTRSSEVKHGQRVSVRKLKSMQESVDILSNASGKVLSVNDPDVTTLVEKLDGLPLALATTGAYLEQASVSVATYLRLYESSWTQLHQDDPGLDTYEDRTLYSTWRISWEQIQKQNELSAKVLDLWCYFSNQDLWYELLHDGDVEHLPWLRNLTDSLPVFIKAMRLLCNYGLAESDTSSTTNVESGGYSIHPCVHSWTIHVLNKRWDDTLAKFAVSAIGQHVTYLDAEEPWTTQRRLVPHAERCLKYLSALDSAQPGVGESLHSIADLFSFQDKMQGAAEMYVRALRGKEELWGPKHTSTLNTVNDLGLLYANQGKMAEAEEMYLRALRGKEEAWGPNHTSTLNTVHNLGLLYAKQGKMAEAGEMYLRALRGKEEAWGPKHTSTLDTVNNLGNLYSNQGRIQEAEEMYLRALRGYREAWGPKHTSTLETVSNLAILYSDQGKIQEAEEMYLQALRGKEEAWGPKHTSTLNTVNCLSSLYRTQGRIQEAEEMYLRALRGYEEAWGPKHTSTLDIVNNLGLLYADQGKIQEAEEMHLRALRGKEEAWGPKHTSTLDTVNNLGNLYTDQGKIVEAEEMHLRALRGKEEAWGPKHTSTLDTVNNLGLLYANQGKMAEAEEMYLRALRGYREAWGPKHTSTFPTVHNLGLLYAKQGKMAEAEEMYLRALRVKEEAWDPKHTSTLDTVNNLGLLYADQGKIQEAEEMYLRALRGKEEACGPKHTSTLDTVNNLAVLYTNQGKMAEAEEMHLRALRGKEEAWGLKHTSTLDTVNNLAVLYANQGKMAEAEEMYLRALRGYREAWGPKHTSTLDTVNNLAILYSDQGKIQEAEEMYLQALRGKEEAWGPNHTSTLSTVHNLGLLYANQGKMAEAEEMHLRALRGKEEACGPKHTSTLDTVYKIGLLYDGQGRIQQAEAMYTRALAGYQEVEGDRKAYIDYIKDRLSSFEVRDHPRDAQADRSLDASHAPLANFSTAIIHQGEASQSGHRGRKRDIVLSLFRKH